MDISKSLSSSSHAHRESLSLLSLLHSLYLCLCLFFLFSNSNENGGYFLPVTNNLEPDNVMVAVANVYVNQYLANAGLAVESVRER